MGTACIEVFSMNEDNGEESSKEVSKKRTRGPTTCKKLKKRMLKQKLECSIDFDDLGDPIGDLGGDFRKYVGSVVRFQVDINVESWDVVNEGLKDAIWDHIKMRWKLDDSRKKNLLERAGKQWRDFKGKLNRNFLHKGKNPCEKYQYITEEMWDIFKKRRETEEFKEISEKAKESQKHNEHVHYLGPGGYAGHRGKWSVEDPINSLKDSESIDPSIVSSQRTGRSYDWIRARTKPLEDGGYYFPNEKTKEVFQKMGELESQISDGSWTPQGHDDILSSALGTKEHGGRVSGVGGSVKIKDVFGSGKNKHNGVVSVDELAKITQEITKKVQKEFEEKMNDMMNSKLEGIFNQLKQIGVSLPDDIGTSKNEVIRRSCQSVDREDHFSDLKIPTLCSLWVLHSEKGRVVVARGTIFPSNSQGSTMLHNKPIAPHNVKVSVDDVVAEYQLNPLPVPCEEHATVGNAAGSFVQWPKDLVTLGQDPISLEKQKSHEMSPKRTVQKSKKVKSKGSVTPMKKNLTVLNDDINSTENCRSLRFLLNKRPSTEKDDVFKFEEDGKDPIHIGPEDVDQFLKMSCLNTSILEVFSKYVTTLCKDNILAFMSPSRLAIPHIRDYQRQSEAAEYLTEFLVANKDKRFILAPYHQE